jgi:hypothetical protein
MRAYAIWLRRGVGAPLGVVLLAFVLTSLLTQPDWQVETDWATRLTAASLIVVCPCVAAAAAFDTSRRWRPTLALLSRGSARRSWTIALPALAVVGWAVLAYLVAWAVAAVVVAAHHGVGVTDWWIFPEIVAPLIGAGMVGLAVGSGVAGRSAAPLAAVAVVAALVVASPWGRGPFEAVTTYGTLTGLQRSPARALAAIAAGLAVALAAFTAAREVQRPDGRRRPVLGAVAVAVVLAAVVPAAWPWHQDVYEVTQEPYGCIGRAPSVCGPRSRLPMLRPVQASFAAAYLKLGATDFTRPTSFRVTRVDHYSELDGAAPLDFDPAFIQGTRYAPGAVAQALVRPHQCRELFGATSAIPLLKAQDRVVPWLQAVLVGRASARPVPADVESSFQLIEHCTPMTGNLR